MSVGEWQPSPTPTSTGQRRSFIDKERTTVCTWNSADGSQAESRTQVTSSSPGFWDRSQQQRIAGSGTRKVTVEPPPTANPYERNAFPVDPRDGRHKLRVEITMDRPDQRTDGWVSGRFLREFELTTAIGADAGPAVTATGPHEIDILVRGYPNDDLVHASTTVLRGAAGGTWEAILPPDRQ